MADLEAMVLAAKAALQGRTGCLDTSKWAAHVEAWNPTDALEIAASLAALRAENARLREVAEAADALLVSTDKRLETEKVPLRYTAAWCELTKLSDALRGYRALRDTADHEWFERHNLTCCRKCGIVRRADGKNKPCRGVVKVELRAALRAPGEAAP